ncbi:MAG: hypothetical protein QOE89_2379 [Pseudonocardiales bacterium]|nr:hypothetical protein [Pseudonocardiales bacterium]
MGAPLLSEGTDPQAMLAAIRAEYGDAVTIVYQDRVRRGGFAGFFTREVFRIAYRLPELTPPGTQPGPVSLDDLLAAADADEAAGADETADQPNFTAVLQLTLADEPELPVAVPAPRNGAAPEISRFRGGQTEASPLASVTAMHPASARARLDLLMGLREIGVPVGINPTMEAHGIFHAMEEILGQLPPAPPVPSRPGKVTALVGELTPALRAAQSIASTLRIAHSSIWVAGLPGHPVESLCTASQIDRVRSLNGPDGARRLRSELHGSNESFVVVIATDSIEGDPEDRWASEVLRALRPDAAWLMVDATRKVEDERARLDRIGGIDALALYSAKLSSSPATAWDLGLPIALLDGRPATTFAWSSLLFSALPAHTRHEATA